MTSSISENEELTQEEWMYRWDMYGDEWCNQAKVGIELRNLESWHVMASAIWISDNMIICLRRWHIPIDMHIYIYIYLCTLYKNMILPCLQIQLQFSSRLKSTPTQLLRKHQRLSPTCDVSPLLVKSPAWRSTWLESCSCCVVLGIYRMAEIKNLSDKVNSHFLRAVYTITRPGFNGKPMACCLVAIATPLVDTSRLSQLGWKKNPGHRSGWWLSHPSSTGMMTFPIYGTIKNVPKHQPV